MSPGARIRAVTLDFFNTLAFLRTGRGRGPTLMEYLEARGFRPAPWQHQVLYDVFEPHDRDYSPAASLPARRRYHLELATRVFERLQIPTATEQIEEHADAIWDILGPSSLEVYADVPEALQSLRKQGLPLAMISNWQCGLRHFCHELGLSPFFRHILGSADLDMAKPEPPIFRHACECLGVAPEHILHIGDTFVDDYEGGESAGLQVRLLARDRNPDPRAGRVIHGLGELPDLVSVARRTAPRGG